MADGNKMTKWEDIMHLPDERRPELIAGKEHFRAAPRTRHGFGAHRVSVAVDPATRRNEATGWWICQEPDIALSDTTYLRPDLAGWRKVRMPELTDEWPTRLPPDWVCEILSPSNAVYDRRDKASEFARAGVPWLWLVDPQERLVEVFKLRHDEELGNRWLLVGVYGADAVQALPPFEDVVVQVGDLFAPLAASVA